MEVGLLCLASVNPFSASNDTFLAVFAAKLMSLPESSLWLTSMAGAGGHTGEAINIRGVIM